MWQVIPIWYEMHQLFTQNSNCKTFTMILAPHWLSCLLASALPGSIWMSEMLETCLEKPVFRVSIEQNYQQDQMVIENIFRLVSSTREWQIISINVFLDSCRFNSSWGEMPSLENHLYQQMCLLNCGQGEQVPTLFLWFAPRRWLNVDLSSVLLLSVFRQQRVGYDRLAVPLLWGQHRRLERPGCDHRGALPHRQKVLRIFLLLFSTLWLCPFSSWWKKSHSRYM